MVVLAAAVSTKSGKAIFSRQFVELSRTRIEGLLAAFPKLIAAGQEHTHIETENVRYVYQPLEELFVILITNKTSNILQDLDTLHLFARTVTEYCRHLNEEDVRRYAFDLLNAFDEIVSLGYRENVNLNQIKTFIEMESHEEKIQEQHARNKEQEAREAAKLKIKQMEMARKEALRTGRPLPSTGMGRNSSQTGFGSGSVSMGGMGGGNGSGSGNNWYSVPPQSDSRYGKPIDTKPSSPAPTSSKAKGMVLTRKSKDDFMEVLKTEEVVHVAEVADNKTSSAPAVQMEGVHLTVEEKIIVVANRDGGLQSLEVKGVMMVRITDADKAKVRVGLALASGTDLNMFKTHPNMNANAFKANSTIESKDPSKPFPLNQPLTVVKWRFTSKDDNDIPLLINCWPTLTGDGGCDVNIDYELVREDLELRDVIIGIGIPSSNRAPVVNSVEGEYRFNKSQQKMEWILPLIDRSSKRGSLEFSVGGEDTNQFFPITVQFVSTQSFVNLQIQQVTSTETNAAINFSSECSLVPEEYVVV